MADKEFLVDVAFNVDEAGASSADNAVNGLDGAVRQLGSGLIQTSQNIRGFVSGLFGSKSAANDAAGSFNGAAQSSKQMSSAFQSAGTSAAKLGSSAKSAAKGLAEANSKASMSNAKTGTQNLKQMERQFKSLFNVVKKFIGIAATAVAGTSLFDAFKNIESMNQGLAQTAKGLNTTLEAARAHTIALQVIGKTADEIKKDQSLQSVYNDLIKIGENLALPEAAQGLTAIQRLKDGLMQLKATGNYALQWIYYKMQSIADGPLAQLRGHMTAMQSWLSGNMEEIAESIATAFKWVIQIINSVITAVTSVITAIDKLPASIKTVGAIAIAIIAAVKSKMARSFFLISAILLLIDDFVTYMQGGDALFAGFWGKCIEWADKAKPVINEVITALDSVITKIATAWKDSSSLPDFVKRLAMGDDYQADASWETVGQKVWEKIKSGFKTAKGWIFDLLFPDGVPEDIGGDWAPIAQKISQKLTEALSGKGVTEFATGLIKGITASLTATNPETGKLESGLLDIFKGVLDGIVAGITNAAQAGTSLVTSLVDLIGAIFSEKNISDAFNTSDQFGKTFITAIGNAISGVLDAVKSIDGTEIGSTLATAASNIIKGIFDSVKDLSGDESVSGFLQKIISGLQSAIGTAKDTIQGFVTTLVGSLSDESIWSGLGDSLGGIASKLIEGLASVLTTGSSAASDILANIANAAIELSTQLLTAISSAISNIDTKSIGDAAGEILKNLFAALKNVFTKENIGKLGDSLKGFGSSLMQAISNLFTGFDGSGAIVDVSETISAILGALSQGIADLVTAGGELISDVSEQAKSIATGLVSAITAGISSIDTKTFGNTIGKIISGLANALKTAFSAQNMESVGSIVSGLAQSLIDAIGNAITGINESGALIDIVQFAESFINAIAAGISSLNTETIGKALGDIISTLGNAIKNAFSEKNIAGLGASIQNFTSSLMDAISAAFTGFGESGAAVDVSETISAILTALSKSLSQLFESGSNIISDIGNKAVEFASSLVGAISTGISGLDTATVGDAAGKIISSLAQALKNVFTADNLKSLAGSVAGLGEALMGAIADLFKGLGGTSAAIDTAGALTSIVKSIFSASVDLLAEGGPIQGFAQKLGEAISSLGTIAGQFVGNVLYDIVDFIFSGNALEYVFNAGQGLIELLFRGIAAGLGGIANFAFGIVDVILDKLGLTNLAARNEAEKIGEQIWGSVEAGIKNASSQTSQSDLNALAVFSSLMFSEGHGYAEELAQMNDEIGEQLYNMVQGFIVNERSMQGIINETLKYTDFGGDADLFAATIQSRLDEFAQAMGLLKFELPENFGDHFWQDLYEAFSQYQGDPENFNFMADFFAQYGIAIAQSAEESAATAGAEAEQAFDDALADFQNHMAEKNPKADVQVDAQITVGDLNSEEAKEQIQQQTKQEIDGTSTEAEVKVNVTAKAEDVTVKSGVTVQSDVNAASGENLGKEFIAAVASGIQSGLSSVDTAIKKIQSLIDGVSSSTIVSTFRTVASSISSSMSSAASAVSTQVQAIKDALSTIPEKINVTVTTDQQFGNGGIVNSPTKATVGDDGKEYIIPVTKPKRAAMLLKQAANELGLNVTSAMAAQKTLGSDPTRGFTPAYAAASSVTNNIVNNYNTVNAPATIKVQGTDPKSIANNVSSNQERILMRNIKAAIA